MRPQTELAISFAAVQLHACTTGLPGADVHCALQKNNAEDCKLVAMQKRSEFGDQEEHLTLSTPENSVTLSLPFRDRKQLAEAVHCRAARFFGSGK